MKCVFIDQQGGKGNCASAMDVCGTICSDSHGTPHAVAIIGGLINVSESTRPADDADILGARCVPRGVREQRGRNGEGRSPSVVCFAQNTRDELRIVRGGVCGALAAEPGMKQQNYILSFVLDSH